jgi:hypothetical protein
MGAVAPREQQHTARIAKGIARKNAERDSKQRAHERALGLSVGADPLAKGHKRTAERTAGRMRDGGDDGLRLDSGGSFRGGVLHVRRDTIRGVRAAANQHVRTFSNKSRK